MTSRKSYRRRGFTPEQTDAYRKAAEARPGWMIETRLDPKPGFVPDGMEEPAVPRREPPAKPKTIVAKLDLSDPRIEARIEMNLDKPGTVMLLHDHGGGQSIPGLRIRLGPRSATWLFYRDVLDHGRRTITSQTLGSFPIMDTAAARKAASIVSGDVAGGRGKPGRAHAIKFGEAFASYLEYLAEGTADEPGISEDEKAERKPARWRKNCRALGTKYLLPKFENWSVAEMSERRREVGKWYNNLAKESVSSAHHCRRIIRALYNWQIDEGEKLEGINPARAQIARQENYKRRGVHKPSLALDQFPAWIEAWKKLPPLNRSYHLTGIFCGARPGELSRTIYDDLDLTHNTLTIGNSKNGSDLVIPLSEPIIRALGLAREATRAEGINSDLIFPGSGHFPHRDDLPARGHALRRAYKTVCTTLLIPDETSGRLLGHRPPGVSASYNDPLEVQRGAMLRELQCKISAEMIRLFGCDPTLEKIAPVPRPPFTPSPAQLRYRNRGR